jgi:tetratricopeptide (TPR) repeat protein
MADIVNYYDELGLDRDASIAEIQEGLNNLKLQLASKVARPGSQQEKWKRQLELVDQAKEVFKDEDSRDTYDIGLRRAGSAPAEDQTIDWTTRAWNYYFIGDDGAALVAARKAREQAPDSPMPFVVSAWVHIKNKEWKQARQDADEAFVLDELTADSVDVLMVRGTAYHFLRDFDRALTSFDRALTKAADGEKPEIHWRKALVHRAMGNWQETYESGVQGLTGGVEMTDSMRDNLEGITSDAFNHLDNVADAAEAARKYDSRKSTLSSMSMAEPSKSRLIDNASQNAQRCRELDGLRQRDAALTEKRESLRSVVQPDDGVYPFPGVSLGMAILFFFIIIIVAASRGSGVLGLILMPIDAAIIIYVLKELGHRSEFQRSKDWERARYGLARRELEEVERESNEVTRRLYASPKLTEPILLTAAR